MVFIFEDLQPTEYFKLDTYRAYRYYDFSCTTLIVTINLYTPAPPIFTWSLLFDAIPDYSDLIGRVLQSTTFYSPTAIECFNRIDRYRDLYEVIHECTILVNVRKEFGKHLLLWKNLFQLNTTKYIKNLTDKWGLNNGTMQQMWSGT